jgi:dUTP pyrophosphatase
MSDMIVDLQAQPMFSDLGQPHFATAEAAAFDLRVCRAPGEGPIVIPPGKRALVPTGFCFEIPRGYYMQLSIRSGLALKSGLMLMNGVGIIDSDFRGQVCGIVYNSGESTVELKHTERFMQAIILPRANVSIRCVTKVSPTVRGDGGFGSTGRV